MKDTSFIVLGFDLSFYRVDKGRVRSLERAIELAIDGDIHSLVDIAVLAKRQPLLYNRYDYNERVEVDQQIKSDPDYQVAFSDFGGCIQDLIDDAAKAGEKDRRPAIVRLASEAGPSYWFVDGWSSSSAVCVGPQFSGSLMGSLLWLNDFVKNGNCDKGWVSFCDGSSWFLVDERRLDELEAAVNSISYEFDGRVDHLKLSGNSMQYQIDHKSFESQLRSIRNFIAEVRRLKASVLIHWVV